MLKQNPKMSIHFITRTPQELINEFKIKPISSAAPVEKIKVGFNSKSKNFFHWQKIHTDGENSPLKQQRNLETHLVSYASSMLRYRE